jgi:hypothetical protein
MNEKCHVCPNQATHWRRYEMPHGEVVDEFYLPYCDPCAQASVSASAAPRIPLVEVFR